MNKIAVLTVAAIVSLFANAGIVSAASPVTGETTTHSSSLVTAANEGGAADANAKLEATCKKMSDSGKKMNKACNELHAKQSQDKKALK